MRAYPLTAPASTLATQAAQFGVTMTSPVNLPGTGPGSKDRMVSAMRDSTPPASISRSKGPQALVPV